MTSREERFAAHDLSRVTATATTTLSSLSSSSNHHHQLQQQQHLHHHQHYTTLSHDELRITATSATTATQQHHHGVVGHLAAAAVAAEDFSSLLPPLGVAAPDMDQQILELIQKQEQQKQRLYHSYQEKTKQLELEHKMQLEHKYQELREQRLATTVEEQQQRERRDREVIKRKENCSANASPEVKQILNYFLKSKQAASSNGMATSSRYRNGGIVKSSSGESLPAGSVSSSHPYKIPQPPPPFLKYESDFPLRKTASEPNLLKIRLKQSVIERKARICGPAGARRHERILSAAQRRQQKHNTAAATAAAVAAVALTNSTGTPDSGPNSPPSSTLSSVVGSRGSPTSAPIQEENEEGSQYQPGQRSSINDLSLFSSPSMPNISLGRPHLSNAHAAHTNFALLATLRQHVQHGGGSGGAAASASAAVGGPPSAYYPLAAVYGGRHLPTSMLPPVGAAGGGSAAVPPLPSPVVRSASGTSTSSSQASLVGECHTPPQGMGGAAAGSAPPPPAAHAASSISSLMGQATAGGPAGHGPGSVIHTTGAPAGYGQPITDVQVAHAHLNKQGHRPLGRTQSAPLPLGHPMLTGTGSNQIQIGQTHYENISEAERQHMLLTQKIRQTVLTRSGAVREPQLKEEDDSAEVIDLTDKQKPPKTVLTSTVMTSTAQMLPEASAATGRQPPPPPLTTTALACHAGLKSKPRDQEYLQQQRELLYQQSQLQVDPEAMMRGGFIRTLSRTLSSPLVHMGSPLADTGQHGLPHHISPIVTSSSADHIPPSAVNLTVPHAKRQLILDYSSSSSSCTSSATAGSVHYPPTPSASSASAVSAGSASGSSLNLRITAVPAHKLTTGLAYDNVMLKHTCICGNNGLHPEHSGRLQSVWARLNETDLAKRCDRLHSRKATQEELQSVHTEAHSLLFGSSQGQLNRQKLENIPSASFVRLSCGGVGVDLDTTWNEQHTAAAARMAAGCVIDLAFKTAKGDIKNGFAVVRPPGHHAEANLAMGFCFFNSIAVAAKLLRQRMPEMRRILIVDWDVHHGNGTQQAFYDNPDVLYLSIHRHDDGNFFPGTGGPTECGSGPGLGYNVNISWSGGLDPPLGDAEYIAAFRTIVMPIAKSFNPDIVLVSSGFDAAAGHSAPLGGYLVSPACFGYMTRELMQLANGRVVLALEGGYDLPAICDSAQECVRALLGDPLSPIAERELKREPCRNAIDTLQKTIAIQLQHWPCVSQLAHTVAMPAIATLKTEHDESDTVTAMAGLSMHPLRTLSREDSEEPMDQDEAK